MAAPADIAARAAFFSATRRTVLLLALCQATQMTGATIVATTGAIVGSTLAPVAALSTLPIAVQMTGTMCATIPAALLMARIGRRPGFWLGAAIGASGASIAAVALFRGDFALFCLGTFLLGTYNGVAQQYRFAASEIADEAFRAKAISLVLTGGVISATLGPELAKWTSTLFGPILFAGCYVAIVALCAVAAAILCYLFLRWLYGTRFRLAINAIRDDEDKAEALGLHTGRYKMVAWSVSAFFLGIAGGLFGNMTGFIEPLETAYPTLTFGIFMVAMTLLGGKGTLWGPIVGATVFYTLRELTWTYLLGWQYIALGVLIIVNVVFFQQGILGWVKGRKPEWFGVQVEDPARDKAPVATSKVANA